MFYQFRQNNSGGSFEITNTVDEFVIIEAPSAIEANYRAERIGIYFDGVIQGIDCECCGNRWYRTDGPGDDVPKLYYEVLEIPEQNQSFLQLKDYDDFGTINIFFDAYFK